ncbi:major tail protein [Clostridium senegalense]|uniref:major tail protein n=1 Tax=Clostridium senegalense TaxID=1465809 RepID=UPI0002886FF2|nr:major tail protein [Clostridium senegalense]
MSVHFMVDLKKLYIAELKQDSMETLTYEIPKYFEGIREIGVKPKINTDNAYAEGIVWSTETTLESIEVEIDIVDLEEEEEAFLLGHKIAEGGGVIYSENDKAPEVAILAKALKGNGKARYFIYYSGQFTISDETMKGKEGKANNQSKKLKATFKPLKHNGQWKFKIDEEQGMTDEKFFESVIIPEKKEITA